MSDSRCRPEERDCYAVMGNPIGHSKSPQIHRMFAEQTGESIGYDALLVAEDGFAEAVVEFMAMGGKGLNVTVPFKQEAWQIADRLSSRAERAGAVNTLSIGDGVLNGDNTDGVGLVRDLTANLGIEISDRSILMLGAGGAARGVLAPLLAQQPGGIHIANRTPARAVELADAFADLGMLVGTGFEALAGLHFDIVINATAAGLQGQVPGLPPGVIDADSFCYDMMYGTEPTAFMRYAAAQGCEASHDGLGMLVEQAAESFRVWRKVSPDTAPVIAALRSGA